MQLRKETRGQRRAETTFDDTGPIGVKSRRVVTDHQQIPAFHPALEQPYVLPVERNIDRRLGEGEGGKALTGDDEGADESVAPLVVAFSGRPEALEAHAAGESFVEQQDALPL